MRSAGYQLLLVPVLLLQLSCTIDSGMDEFLTWERKFDLPAGERIIRVENGGYLVTGYEHVIRLNRAGELLWSLPVSSRISEASNFRIFDLIFVPETRYLLLGTHRSSSMETTDLMVVMLDDNGEIVFTQKLANGVFGHELTIGETESGFAVGAIELNENRKQLRKFVLDTSGRVTDLATYPVSSDKERSVKKLFSVPGDTGYIIVTLSEFIQGEEEETVLITKLDSNLNREWALPIDLRVFFELRSVRQTNDGDFIFAGTIQSDGWCFKVSSEGTMEWDRIFGSISGGRRFLWDAALSADGSIILSGKNSGKGLGSYDAWVLKLDSTGELMWDVVHGTAEYEDARSITITTDGGFALVGAQAREEANLQLWVLKLDKDGEL